MQEIQDIFFKGSQCERYCQPLIIMLKGRVDATCASRSAQRVNVISDGKTMLLVDVALHN